MPDLRKLAAVATAGVLAVPAVAVADKGGQPNQNSSKQHGASGQSHGKHKAKGKGRNLTFKGTLTGAAQNDQVTVMVTGGNKPAKQFRGQSVTFTLTNAKIRVADTDNDGKRNEAGDLKSGDKVVVKVRLAKGQQPSGTTFNARQLVDQTHKHG